MRIALFITCLNNAMAPQAGRATVEILERLGHEVVFPDAQTCCGQMHANTGYQLQAVPLARRTAEVAPRVFKLSEFLVGRLGVDDVGAVFPHRVTYHRRATGCAA